jgi:hypothetical protein
MILQIINVSISLQQVSEILQLQCTFKKPQSSSYHAISLSCTILQDKAPVGIARIQQASTNPTGKFESKLTKE